MPKCIDISLYKSVDIAPNILYTILFIVNCNECLSAEFVGQTSVPYKRIFYMRSKADMSQPNLPHGTNN